MIIFLCDQTGLIDSTYIQLGDSETRRRVVAYCYGEVVTVWQLSMSHCFQVDGLESECDGDGHHPGRQNIGNF